MNGTTLWRTIAGALIALEAIRYALNPAGEIRDALWMAARPEINPAPEAMEAYDEPEFI